MGSSHPTPNDPVVGVVQEYPQTTLGRMSRHGRHEIDLDRYDDRRPSRGGGRHYDEEIDFRRGSGPVPQRAGVTIVKERDREDLRTPAFLRDDYGRSKDPGTMVLRAREREEIDFRARRRTPSPELRKEKESIVVRRDRSESKPAPVRRRDESIEREEIIIRREEREVPPPRRPRKYAEEEREEIIIRRDEREAPVRRGARGVPKYQDEEREEIIIRREERESRPPKIVSRPISHERARSRARSDVSHSEDEIIIRRSEREGRGGRKQETEEIVIRRSEQSRSPSPVPSMRPELEPAPPQVVYAPQIHQEVVTHHRHIDHGYDVQIPTRYVSRPPSPPSPPPPPARARAHSEERIEIRRSDVKNGRRTEEDIIIDRHEHDGDARGLVRNDFRERDEIAISRTRYEDDHQHSPGGIGPRYAKHRDPTDGLWTEVTKDLVVKEAIEQMGYEYQENDDFYYIFQYMKYVS